MNNVTIPIIAICRHRMGTDGKGVTTLVAIYGCPLSCKYCINKEFLAHEMRDECIDMNALQLYEKVKVDNLYFLATNGGVTFGGGEPLLYYEFIKEFKSVSNNGWNISVETSLNVPSKNVYESLDAIDEYIIDIKDMDFEIYKSYTGKNNYNVLKNLKILVKNKNIECLKIRVPKIKDYNDENNIKESIKILRELGIRDIQVFDYYVKE